MSSSLLEIGASFTNRHVRLLKTGDSEVELTLLNTTYTVWLYSDSVSSKGEGEEFWLEEWDARTPKDLIDTAKNKVRELVLKNRLSAA